MLTREDYIQWLIKMQRTPGWQEYGEAIVARYDKTLPWLDLAAGVEEAKRESGRGEKVDRQARRVA